MTEHKADMNITKINKYNKKKTEQHFYNHNKNKQVPSQIKIYNEHLNNITKIGKYKITDVQSIKEQTRKR